MTAPDPVREPDPGSWMHGDAVVALADLIGRCGASGLELGYVHDGVPVEEAGWYAHAQFKGTRIIEQDHRSPSGAALALAERLLARGRCRCGKTVTLVDSPSRCRWQLMGQRWEPGCDAPSVRIDGQRGDLAALHAAMDAVPANRAARRRAQRRGGRRG